MTTKPDARYGACVWVPEHGRIETTLLREAGVRLSAFTSAYSGAEPPLCRSAGTAAICGSQYPAEPAPEQPLRPPLVFLPVPSGEFPLGLSPKASALQIGLAMHIHALSPRAIGSGASSSGLIVALLSWWQFDKTKRVRSARGLYQAIDKLWEVPNRESQSIPRWSKAAVVAFPPRPDIEGEGAAVAVERDPQEFSMIPRPLAHDDRKSHRCRFPTALGFSGGHTGPNQLPSRCGLTRALTRVPLDEIEDVCTLIANTAADFYVTASRPGGSLTFDCAL